nr:TonB-dependent receptor plug domain-containing protein [Halomonas socia]
MANEPGQDELAPLVVTGTRTPTDTFRAPLIIDTLDRHDPTLSTATRLEDALGSQPGLTVAGQGRRNGQTSSMRGFDRNGVLVRLDGIRQDIDTGHLGNVFVDPGLLREVQIARGALSSLYGSNAMGGVISLDTVDAGDLLRPGKPAAGGCRCAAPRQATSPSPATACTTYSWPGSSRPPCRPRSACATSPTRPGTAPTATSATGAACSPT